VQLRICDRSGRWQALPCTWGKLWSRRSSVGPSSGSCRGPRHVQQSGSALAAAASNAGCSCWKMLLGAAMSTTIAARPPLHAE
jgi:hypothetical protein